MNCPPLAVSRNTMTEEVRSELARALDVAPAQLPDLDLATLLEMLGAARISAVRSASRQG